MAGVNDMFDKLNVKNGEKDTDETAKEHPSGIPAAKFVEDVDDFMNKQEQTSADSVIKILEEQHNKYKFMEMNLSAKKRRLRLQIPDLERSLNAIKMLRTNKAKGKEDVTCDFLVSDGVYSQAKIPTAETVYLWLGANVMLEYSLDDATTLLKKNIENATSKIETIDRDLDFLREQCTTTEVNMARFYNWNVKTRQYAESKTNNAVS